MKLPNFIFQAIVGHNTSIGKNDALPTREDVSFDYIVLKNRYKQILAQIKKEIGYIPTIQEAEAILSKLLVEVNKIEEPLKPQLEKLCEAVANNVLGVPQETILLDCNLVNKIVPDNELRIMPESDDSPEYTFDDVDEISIANKCILKRRLINTLVQGAAYWLMIDFFDNDKLNEWSNELVPLYLKIIALNDFLLFNKKEIISDKNPMLGAYVETHLGQDDEKTVITSQGLIYPLLLQETFRGFFELFASHGLPRDTKKANYIIHHADFLMAEAWDLRIGAALWERIETCTNVKPLPNMYPYIVSSLSQLKVDEFNDIMQNLLSHTKKGKGYIDALVKEIIHDDEYQLFKNDIEHFNLERCVINDDESETENVIAEDLDQFKSWFGASIAVDKNGEPIKCYHSTNANFDVFDSDKIGSGGVGAYNGYGFNFTTLPNNTYGKYMYEAYLKATNPLKSNQLTISFKTLVKILIDIDKVSDDSIAVNFTGNYTPINGKGYAINIQKSAKTILENSESDLDVYADICIAACCNPQHVIKIFQKNGFDSTIEYNNEGEMRVIVVFDTNQIWNAKTQPIYEDISYSNQTNGLNDWLKGTNVVNLDGTPKLMYRGDSQEIDSFDRSQSSYSNLYGTGFYFTDSKSHATQYGEPQAYYLRIIHPLSTERNEITKKQMLKFLKCVDNNEDYGLYNYGYGSTPDSVLNMIWGKSDFAMLLDINACCIGDLVEATLLFNKINGTNFDGFILDTETVVFDNSQIRKANIQLSESRVLTEGKVEKQAKTRTYQVLKNGNSWVSQILDKPCNEEGVNNNITYFDWVYQEITSHWCRQNIKLTPVIANILYNELGYQDVNPKVDEINTFKDLSVMLQKDSKLGNQPWTEVIKYSYEDLYQYFKPQLDEIESNAQREMDSMEYNKSDYQVIVLNSQEEAKPYGDKTGGDNSEGHKMCYTQSISTWDSYMCNGNNTLYLCLKNGWENVKAQAGEGAPFDEYGLSMIFVIVDGRGRLVGSNVRWNHAHIENWNSKHQEEQKTVDKILSPVEISRITNLNFKETFKGKKQISLSDICQKLKTVEWFTEMSQYFDYYTPIGSTGCYITQLNEKFNIVDFNQRKFIFNDWYENIEYIGYDVVKISGQGKEVLYDPKSKHVVVKANSQITFHRCYEHKYASCTYNNSDDKSYYIYNFSTQSIIRNEGYKAIEDVCNGLAKCHTKNGFYEIVNCENGELFGNQTYQKADWVNTAYLRLQDMNGGYYLATENGFINQEPLDDIYISKKGYAYGHVFEYLSPLSHGGGRYALTSKGGIYFALFEDGQLCTLGNSRVCGYEKHEEYEELAQDMDKFIHNPPYPYHHKNYLEGLFDYYIDRNNSDGLNELAEDFAETYGGLGNLKSLEDDEYKQQIFRDSQAAAVMLCFNYHYMFDEMRRDDEYQDSLENESYNKQGNQLNEYLDKDYMKPLYDYLKNGDRYSSEGHYNASERLIIPFFEWCTNLDDNEWKSFRKALNNCTQLQEKVRGVNSSDGKHIIRCYSMRGGQLQCVPTREFLKQNARRIFTITYNDPELSQYWDKFYFFINKEEGRQQLKRGQYLDADTVLMNPEIKKPMWLVHFTGNEEDALDIVQHGFKYGLLPNQMSKLGYTNKDIDKANKQGKYMYAYNAEEIIQGFFPADIQISQDKWSYDNKFDQKVWENAIHYAVMFVAPGIEARHDTDNQQQVIFNADAARNFVLLSFIWNKDKSHEWCVQSINGNIIYKHRSLTKLITWVINNFNQYRGKICWSHSIKTNESQEYSKVILNENMAMWKFFAEIKETAQTIYNQLQEYTPQLKLGKSYHKNMNICGNQANIWYVKYNGNDYSGLSHEKDNTIDIIVSLDSSLKNIEDILTHELTHQNNKLYDKSRTGHYFGQHTFKWPNNKGGKIQSKALDNVNAILYNLWSNDELSAYQARSVHTNFSVLENRYSYLKGLIDDLERKQPKEEQVYQATRNYLIKLRKDTKKERIPSIDNFKQWFIKESRYRLENYWKRLLKNWYKYHTEINPDGAIDNLRSKNDKIYFATQQLDNAKSYINQNIEDIASKLTAKVIECIDRYWSSTLGDPTIKEGPFEVSIRSWRQQKEVKTKMDWGGYRYTHKPCFMYRNKPAQFTVVGEKYFTIEFSPTKYLEDVMQYNMGKNRQDFKYDSNAIFVDIKKAIIKQSKTMEIAK